MRHEYSTITPAVVHRQAGEALEQSLDWRPHHQSVSVFNLIRLLLLVASYQSSLSAIVRRFFSFSHETASQAVKAQLSSQERITQGLVQALFDVASFSRSDRRRHWLVAIDTHNVSYYGQPTPHVIGGPKKQGTKQFFGYATAVLLHEHRRYTVGLMALSPRWKPHEVVRALLDQILGKGLKIRGVTLDAAFGSGDTLLLLQEQGVAYAVPLQRLGGPKSVRNQLFQGRHRSIRWTQWTTERSRRLVKTRTLLWKGTHKTMLFAFDGWSGQRAYNLQQTAQRQRRLYQRRFGIETSYRQKNQAKGWTTSRDPLYRLLLEGVAHLLRQVWVALTEQIARRSHAPPTAWISTLPFATLLDWLRDTITAQLPEDRSIPLEPIT